MIYYKRLKTRKERNITQNKKPDYKLKSLAIAKGYTTLERSLSYTIFKKNETGEADFNNYYDFYKAFESDILFKEAQKINKASYNRRLRLAVRIKDILKNNDAYFLTLTFTDKVLSSTSEETRRRYVSRFLKTISHSYVANIDYGKKNQREHYHAVVKFDTTPDMTVWNNKYGFTCCEKVRKTSDNKQLAKYICKLTNHAIKETTRANYCIYSR